MRKIPAIFLLLFCAFAAPAQDLSYYLPDSVSYNPNIPKPADIIYHEVGEWHVTHDRLVNYMKAVAAAAPERVRLETMGFTFERRPQVLLIISSPKNLQRLEEIRQQHLKLSDPSQSASVNIDDMPVVVWIGHSIHGNEASGANASMLSAYYLAAAQGRHIEDILEHMVILFDPSFNPDGLQRFSTWVNQHRSKNLVTDPNSREFNEVWPGGRYNHYWFDLNRDWLPGVHVESQHRLEWFQKWKPNILTDHHEQGSNASFFFQPGVPSRVNPLTPEINQELTAKLAKFHARFLDRIGSLYFTRENYDDFYYGKGSTYPDVQGCVGILFEQASSRGHAQETVNGILRFPFTIRNQFTTTLSTLDGALALRKEFLAYQRDFYKMAVAEGSSAPVKGFVYGDAYDEERTALFTEMLMRHKIEVYQLGSAVTAGDFRFEPGNAFVVPSAQPQYRLIRAIFDKTLDYKDSLFYDVTAWTMPLAFGLPYSPLQAGQWKAGIQGTALQQAVWPKAKWVGSEKPYALLFAWDEYLAPRALYQLQQAGLRIKVATAPFEMEMEGGRQAFGYGTICIPLSLQDKNRDEVIGLVRKVTADNGITVYAVGTGYSVSGVDLGSSSLAPVQKPSMAMFVGPGVNATDAGEIWFTLDQRFDIPATHLETAMFNRAGIDRYNTIIMPGGFYGGLDKNKLKEWVQGGGTLIACEEAVQWLSRNDIIKVSFKHAASPVDSGQALVYADRNQVRGAQRMAGAIFRADIDQTHPLGYGFHLPYVDLFKSNTVFVSKMKNPYATPASYGKSPLQSGFVTRENYAPIKNSAAVFVQSVGSGRVICIVDNPNFRAFWLGGTKLMMNAIFFGDNIDGSSAREE